MKSQARYNTKYYTMTKEKTRRQDLVAEAVRPVYLIATSIQYALGSLLKSKSVHERQELLKRLDNEATYLKLNLKLLRREVEQEKMNSNTKRKP